MLALTCAFLAFVCPPVEEADAALKSVGQPCGGTCDTLGKCAEGLECYVEKNTASPMSFAILMGGAKKAGVCVESLGEVEERRQMQMGGGVTDADIHSDEVSGAATFAAIEINRQWRLSHPPRDSTSDGPTALAPRLGRIISATQQTVAGTKYTIRFGMSDSTIHTVEVLDQSWMNPRYTLLSDSTEDRPVLPAKGKGDGSGRRLQFVAGGNSPADLDDADLQSAAKFATMMMARSSNSLTPPALDRVVSAQRQVVAGTKWTIVLAMNDGTRHSVQVLDQAWMTPRFTLISDDLLA